jgi:LysR family transcriptional regulator, low CO2-responsive transcriptional regulator
MNYTLHQLRVFQKVVQLKSITKAAEALNMTQPGVSIQMKNLQEQFDMPLTELLGRQLQITNFGRELYAIATRILEEIDLIDYKTKQYKGVLAGKLKFASVSTGKYIIPYFLKGFLDMYNGVDLSLDVTNRREVIANLEKNEVDFALINLIPEHLDLEKEVLMPNKLYLLGGAELKIDEAQNLMNLPLIYREEGSGTRQQMQSFFDNKGVKPQIRLQLKSNEAVKQAVLAGLGYSVIPLVSLKNELKGKQVQIIPTEGFPLQAQWHLVWLKQKRLSPVAAAFLDYIRENKNNIIEKEFSWMSQY